MEHYYYVVGCLGRLDVFLPNQVYWLYWAALIVATIDRLPYKIYDSGGKDVATGEAGDDAQELPPGDYKVVVNAGGFEVVANGRVVHRHREDPSPSIEHRDGRVHRSKQVHQRLAQVLRDAGGCQRKCHREDRSG